MIFALVFGICISCSTTLPIPAPVPTLEISQVSPAHWEVIVRLHDEVARGDSVDCSIYVTDEEGSETEEIKKIASIRLNRTDEDGKFVGIYSNSKDFTHGNKVVVVYQPSAINRSIQASTKMFYH